MLEKARSADRQTCGFLWMVTTRANWMHQVGQLGGALWLHSSCRWVGAGPFCVSKGRFGWGNKQQQNRVARFSAREGGGG
jgi:hypothetical protein